METAGDLVTVEKFRGSSEKTYRPKESQTRSEESCDQGEISRTSAYFLRNSAGKQSEMMFHSLEKNKSSDAKNRQRTIEKTSFGGVSVLRSTAFVRVLNMPCERD